MNEPLRLRERCIFQNAYATGRKRGNLKIRQQMCTAFRSTTTWRPPCEQAPQDSGCLRMPQYTRLFVDLTAVVTSGYKGEPVPGLEHCSSIYAEVHLSSVRQRDTLNPVNTGCSSGVSGSRNVTVATVHSFDRIKKVKRCCSLTGTKTTGG